MTDIQLKEDLANLREIMRLLDEAYDHYFKYEGHCKSAEGYVGLHFTNYFERPDEEPLTIKGVEVYSYVLGPSRTHYFASTDEALAEVKKWHEREMTFDYVKMQEEEEAA